MRRLDDDVSAGHATLIDDCEAREGRLSDWERGFIDALKRQIDQGRPLTPKQSEALDGVWERVTRKGSALGGVR